MLFHVFEFLRAESFPTRLLRHTYMHEIKNWLEKGMKYLITASPRVLAIY